MLLRKFRAGDHGGDLHGLPDVHNMVNQIGKAHLDQPDDGRAGGRDDRTRQVRFLQPLPDGPADHIRAPGHLKNVIKAQLLQRVKKLGNILDVLKLPVKAGRGQRDFVAILADDLQRIRHRHLGVIIAHADAFSAVDASLIDDMRTAAANADRLRGTSLQAVGAGAAFVLFQPHRMKSLLFLHTGSFSRPGTGAVYFSAKLMVIVVPTPTSL